MNPLVDAFWQGRTKFKKKEIGQYFDKPKNPRAACHLGAIYWGVYGTTPKQGIEPLINDFPELAYKPVVIPCEHNIINEPDSEIASILIHLSDEHDGRSWPDRKVAEWLDSVL